MPKLTRVVDEVITSYLGRCHCGAIGFAYDTDLSPHRWSVRACGCSFCRAHGARYISDPKGSVRFDILEPDALVRYSFAHRTAEFLLCGVCGVYIGAVMPAERGSLAVLNLNTLVTEPSDLPAAESSSYGSEPPDQRLARRQARWTPVEGAI